MSKQRAKFRGYAQGKGYQTFDPGYVGLSRQQERDARKISDLKENLREVQARDSKQETAIDRANRITADSRDAAYSFVEDRTYQLKQESLERNKRQEEKNFRAQQAKIEQEQKNLMSLVNFSQTLVESAITIKDKNWDAAAKASYNRHMNNGGIPIDQIQVAEAKKERIEQVGELINQQANDIAKNSKKSKIETAKTVNWVRRKSNAAEFGKMQATATKVGWAFGPWATQKIVESGLTDPNEIKAELNELQITFLKLNGLYDPESKMAIRGDFMHEAMGSMAKARNSIVTKYEGLKVQADSQKYTQNFKVKFFTNKDTESLNEYFKYKSVEYDRHGNMFGRKPGAVLKELLDDVSLISPTEFENIVAGPTSDGIPWKDRFPGIIDELREKREDDTEADHRREVRKRKRENDKLVEEAYKKLVSTPNFTNEDLDKIISTLELTGADTSKLKVFYSESIEGRINTFYDDELADKEKNGTLKPSDVLKPGIPRATRAKYLPIAEKFDEYRKNVGISDKDIRKTFNGALREEIDASSLDSTPHYSLIITEGRAFALYSKTFKDYSADGVKDAHDKAMTFVLTQIKERKGDFRVTEPNEVQSWFGKKAFFSSVTPGNHAGAPEIANPLDFDKTLEELETNPNLINEKVIFDVEVLNDIAKNARLGQPLDIPQFLYDLSNANPERYGSALDMLKGQWKAAGIEAPKVKDFRAEWYKKAEDNGIKKFIQGIRTKQEAMIGYALTSRVPVEQFMNQPVADYISGKSTTLGAKPGTTEYSLNRMIGSSNGLINNETVTYKDGYIIANTGKALQWLITNHNNYGLDMFPGTENGGPGKLYFKYDGDEPI